MRSSVFQLSVIKKNINNLFRKGKVVLDIPIPAKQITSVAFGGPNLDILYVTSASAPITAKSIGVLPNDKQYEQAGNLFKITGLDAKGYPGVNVNL